MKKILFVDDDQMSVEFMKLFFQKENFESFSAGSMSEAITIFNSCHPDIVITDIELVDGSGVEFAQHVKKISKNDVCLIGITGHSEDFLIKSGNDLTCFDHFFSKPIDLEVVKSAIS